MGKPSKPVIDPAKMRDDDNTADANRLVENMKRQGEKSRNAPPMPQVQRSYPKKLDREAS
jgi:hypothetical protein